MSVAEYLSDLIRGLVNRDFLNEMKRMEAESTDTPGPDPDPQ
jgi:hypothetical protein